MSLSIRRTVALSIPDRRARSERPISDTLSEKKSRSFKAFSTVRIWGPDLGRKTFIAATRKFLTESTGSRKLIFETSV